MSLHERLGRQAGIRAAVDDLRPVVTGPRPASSLGACRTGGAPAVPRDDILTRDPVR